MARLYRAPELILGYSHGPAADLWGFACSLYELSTHKFLFPGKNNNHLLRLMTDLCGPVPKDMLAKSAFTSKHYNEKQQLLDLDSSFAPFAAQDKPMGSLLSYLCPKARREKLSPTDAKQLELFRDVMVREALRSWVR
jgi:serine/threonine-protein kinase PRP4